MALMIMTIGTAKNVPTKPINDPKTDTLTSTESGCSWVVRLKIIGLKK